MTKRRVVFERRLHVRSRVPGAIAVVHARTHAAPFAVEDLSPAGARLLGQLPLACGELITVTFDVDNVPIIVSALVVRLDILPGPLDGVAIAFRDVSPALHHFIQRLVLGILKRPTGARRGEAIE